MKKIIYLLSALCLLSVVIFTGCGGATNKDSTDPVTIYSDSSKDGRVVKQPKTILVQPYLDVGGWYYSGGANGIHRSFLHFNISNLSNKNIKSAELYLYRSETIGTPSNLGKLYLDHLDYGVLEKEDFYRAELENKIITLTSLHPNDQIGWETVDLTDFVRNDILNKKSYSQFRLRREKDYIPTNAADHRDCWHSEADNKDLRPKLVVTYQ